MIPRISCRVDTSHFVRAVGILAKRSRNSTPQTLNKAVYFVVKGGQGMVGAMPLTPTTPISRIDSELMVVTSPTVGRRGKLSALVRTRSGGLSYKSSRIIPNNYDFAAGKSDPPLAALIINASVLRVDTAHSQPGMSRYNRLTGMRYARIQSPFKGVGRRFGAAKMTAAISRMVKARHSSTHYFQSSWKAILQQLKPYLPSSYGGGSLGPPVDNSMGAVSPATPSQSVATCIIENRLGMESGSKGNATLSERRNMAAHRIFNRAMQTAVDTHYYTALEKFQREGWREAAPLLAQHGVIVTA